MTNHLGSSDWTYGDKEDLSGNLQINMVPPPFHSDTILAIPY